MKIINIIKIYKNKFILVILIVFLCSCDFTNSKTVNERKLEEIFSNIKISFSFKEMNEIMKLYEEDYLHNGINIEDVYDFWFDAMIRFEELEFEELEFDIEDDYAFPEFTIIFKGKNNIKRYKESEFDYLGDFRLFDKWKLYGNQNVYKL